MEIDYIPFFEVIQSGYVSANAHMFLIIATECGPSTLGLVTYHVVLYGKGSYLNRPYWFSRDKELTTFLRGF